VFGVNSKKKAPPMNDAVKLLLNTPVESLPAMHEHFANAVRTPTPREQEIEAQNKALWELVEAAGAVVSEMLITMKYAEQQGIPHGGLPPSVVALGAKLAAIQKAREAK